MDRLRMLNVTAALMEARRTWVDGKPLELTEIAQIRVTPSFDTLL